MKIKDGIVGILLSIGAVIIALIPFWFYLLMRFALSPTGFWQNFFLLGLGIWLLGGIQILFLIILIIFLCSLWIN